MTNPPDSLASLRAELSDCDREIVEQVARRMKVVERVAALKKSEGLPAFDRSREVAVLERAEALAEERGAPRETVRAMFALLFSASRGAQRIELLRALTKPSVGILGGTAGMGAFFARVLGEAGFNVEVTGLGEGASNEAVAARHDLVIVAVPIASTLDVIREIAPHVREGATLCDVTSLKRAPMEAMLHHAHPSVNVVGTHPMFGPSASGFDRQKVVLCRGRGDDAFLSLRRIFEAFGAECIEVTPADHDAQMALIQVLVHEKTMVLGSVLARLEKNLAESLSFASPIYRVELSMIGRMFSQSPELYADILTSNPDAAALSQVFEEEAAWFAKRVASGDRDSIVTRFREIADYMRDFAAWGRAESDAILRELVRAG